MVAQRSRYRLALLVSLILVIPLGYGARFYLSTNQEWLRNLLGNIAYESFWILLVAFLFPQVSLLRTAIGVCLATFAIEFMQLWQPDWLQTIRATLPGKLVLGNSFVWADFPQYAFGSLVGWLWTWGLAQRTKKQHEPAKR